MNNNDIFDSSYVNNADDTSTTKKQSEVKTLLKEAVNEEEMAKYGSSKPKRVIVKAKITHG